MEEAHHSLIIVEYDPLIDEDAQEMIECISKALKQASYGAKVLFYSSGLNPFSEDLTKLADCILCFEKARYYRYFICSSPLAAAMTFPPMLLPRNFQSLTCQIRYDAQTWPSLFSLKMGRFNRFLMMLMAQLDGY